MKTFIIGTTSSGKTTIAEKLGKAWKMPVISASEWVRTEYNPKTTSKEERAQRLTAYTLEQLPQRIGAASEYIRSHYDLSHDMIIEGVRNPYDFMQLFNPQEDDVITIEYKNNPVRPNHFEKTGIDAIHEYLYWMTMNDIAPEWARDKLGTLNKIKSLSRQV